MSDKFPGCGILLTSKDSTIQAQARSNGLAVAISNAPELPFDRTLVVDAGTRIPWDLLPAAWHYLEKWDAAVPLMKFGTVAADAGNADDRRKTAAVISDLRVPLHAYELLFVRRNDIGRALVSVWARESVGGSDRRLAFLRALQEVKPRVCYLPATWLLEVRAPATVVRSIAHGRSANASRPLIRVEVAPGRFVKAHMGDEEKVLQHFQQMKNRRRP